MPITDKATLRLDEPIIWKNIDIGAAVDIQEQTTSMVLS